MADKRRTRAPNRAGGCTVVVGVDQAGKPLTCGDKVMAKGMCPAHYMAKRRADKAGRPFEPHAVNAPANGAPGVAQNLTDLGNVKVETEIAGFMEIVAKARNTSRYALHQEVIREWYRSSIRKLAVAPENTAE